MLTLADTAKLTGKNTLVVTMGDSWTWGNHLGDDRESLVYGKLLSDYCNADWLNIAKCGCSNYWILDNLYKLILANTSEIIIEDSYNSLKADGWPTYEQYLVEQPNQIKKEIKEFLSYNVYENSLLKNYKEILVVITLTETGREFWDMSPPYNLSTIDEYLQRMEQKFYTKAHDLTNEFNFKLIIGRNFSINYPTTIAYNSLEKSWIEVMSNDHIEKDFLHYGPVGSIGLNFLHSNATVLSSLPLKEYFISQSHKADIVRKHLCSLSECIMCYPNSRAHKMWAEYIYKQL